MISQVVEFLLQHWILTSMLVVIFIAVVVFEVTQTSKQDSISPQAAVGLINHSHAVVLDLRSTTAFKAGHIIKAINIPSKELSANKKLNKYLKKDILLVCEPKDNGTSLVNQLQQEGFEKVKYLDGGIQAWTAAELPIVS